MRKLRMGAHGTKCLLAAMLIAAAFAKGHAMDVSALQGRWVLEAVDGKTIGSDRGEIYFEIRAQAISGYDGCNRFGGTVGPPARIQKGLRGCPPDAVLLPLDLSNLDAQLSRAAVSGNQLTVPLPDGKGEARFRRSQ